MACPEARAATPTMLAIAATTATAGAAHIVLAILAEPGNRWAYIGVAVALFAVAAYGLLTLRSMRRW